MKLKFYFYITVAYIFYLLISIAPIYGQVKVFDNSLYDFKDLQRKQTWTESYNAAGLYFIDFNKASYLEAYVGDNSGSFVKYYESDESLNFGLRTESYAKVKKIIYYGKLGYDKFLGNNMTWSGQIYPEKYLLNVADDIPAKKAKESYYISSGLSAPITNSLLLGFKFNYEVANLAKRKDLRHKTDLLDVEFSGGLLYKINKFNIGANYYYRKFHENVAYSKVAKDEINYNGYLFKGLWFGINDTWSQDVIKLSRPFLDVQEGISIQVEGFSKSVRFFNEFTYKRQEGFTGSGADKEYSQSKVNIFEYKNILQYGGERNNHYFKLDACYSEGINYDKITNQVNIGGINVIQYYGLNKIFTKREFNINPEYELSIGKDKYNSLWSFTLGYYYNSQYSVSSLVYPHYFSQKIFSNLGYVKANKRLILQKGVIDLSLSYLLSGGYGDKLQHHISDSGEKQASEDVIPYQNIDMLNKEFEYLTARKNNGGIGVKYSCFLAKIAGSLYVNANFYYTTTPDVLYHSNNKARSFNLALGYSF